MGDVVFVGPIKSVLNQDGTHRVSSMVQNVPLWFESADTKLELAAEGFASALLVPAMSQGVDLVFEDPLCTTWLENSRKLIETFSGWWGWPPISVTSNSVETPRPAVGKGRILCFSAGVDSFYSLLTYPGPIDRIVMVHGYDIDVEDEDGAYHLIQHLKQVAVEKGVEAVVVKTNFRKHPVAGKKYKYAYGGALAAMGHLLSNTSEVVISSGFRYDEAMPDGSHWQNDRLWSSQAMNVVHYGADHIRDHKLRKIAGDPSFRKHVRVCQENLKENFRITDKVINCGRCQKCVRTLLVLQQEGPIDDLDIFENRTDLDLYLYDQPVVGEYLFKAYGEIIDRGVDEGCVLSIRALMRRSRILPKFGWSGRKGHKLLVALFKFLDMAERRIRLKKTLRIGLLN